MGIQAQKIEPHWNYLIAIERDVDRLSRFVEFDQRNFDCFSIEIARILLAAGAEVDVVCRQLCVSLNQASTASNIHTYRKELTTAIPELSGFEVLIPRYGLSLHPWDEWTQPDGVPFWWTAYNKIKHARNDEFHRASLKNALNAIAGLFVVLLYLNSERARSGNLVPATELLQPGEAHFGGHSMGMYEMAIVYRL